jgi:putative MATE family efflux protein
METISKFEKMTQTPIPRLIINLAIPTIISMLITSHYNMADTFFVGKIGTSATAAVGISFSLMAIVQAVGFTLGMGSGNYISRLLGQQNAKDASNVAAAAFFTSIGIGAVLTVIGLILIDPLVNALGATPTIHPYARDYIRYILLGIPFIMASYVLNNILRFQGSALFAMFGILLGTILNIGLDPVFIFVLNMGTGGAALATIISQFISFCLLLFASGKGGNLKIRLKDFSFDWAIYKEILRGGLPSFYRQGLASIATIALNLVSRPFGDAAIAAMSIVGRVLFLAISILLGFGQGFQPVCGFNYGAKLYNRVLEGSWFCVKTAAVFLCAASLIGFIFAPQIIAVFRRDDLEVIRIGTLALRLQCITFPLSSLIIIGNMLLQTIGEAKKASILALARQGLFFLPLIIILPRVFGLLGIQLSQPIADIFALSSLFLW